MSFNRKITVQSDMYLKLKANEYNFYEVLPFTERELVRRGMDTVLNVILLLKTGSFK